MFNIINPPKFLSISLTFVLVSIALVSFSQSKLSQLVIQSKPAIFSITCYDKSDIPFSYGTGFFIDSEGTGLTNYHVLEGASYAVIKTLDGNHYKIDQIISQNKKIDLIKFKVKKTSKIFPYLKLCPTSPIEAEEVLVIGNPKELEYSVSNGIISSLRNDEEMGKVIQITAPISSGSSGSPLLNLKGEVLGVVSFTMKEGQNLNFAISVKNLGNLIPYEEVDFPASEEVQKVATENPFKRFEWGVSSDYVLKNEVFKFIYKDRNDDGQLRTYFVGTIASLDVIVTYYFDLDELSYYRISPLLSYQGMDKFENIYNTADAKRQIYDFNLLGYLNGDSLSYVVNAFLTINKKLINIFGDDFRECRDSLNPKSFINRYSDCHDYYPDYRGGILLPDQNLTVATAFLKLYKCVLRRWIIFKNNTEYKIIIERSIVRGWVTSIEVKPIEK